MRTARQPTIKTLLLMMAVIAVQCAAMPSPVEEWGNDDLSLYYFRASRWSALAAGILFWSVLPVVIALFIRSPARGLAVGFGFGLLAIGACYYSISVLDSATFNSAVSWIWGGILYGPCGCVYPMRAWWYSAHAEPMPVLLTFAIYLVWLVTYTTTCFFVAKSCGPAKATQTESMHATLRRPWFQFSLRTLFILVTLVAICLFLWKRGIEPIDGLMIAAPITAWYLWRKHINSKSLPDS
jgi:hypothetical protein